MAPPHPSQEVFVSTVLQEFEIRTSGAPFSPCSVYVGGGTPSQLRPEAISRLLHGLGVTPGNAVEVTVEMNPGDGGREFLAALAEAGVNRLSIGAQSLDDERLGFLGRRHDAAEVRRAVAQAREAGFANVSVDLIYGTPGQTLHSLGAEIDAFIELDVPHISAYELTIASGTPFAEAGVAPLDDDLLVAMWHLLAERLDAARLSHYEVSNAAWPGFESAHNKHYWDGGEYLGLGPSACGFLCQDGRSVRYRNAPWSAWMKVPVASAANEAPDDLSLARERVMLGLRRRAGVDLLALVSLLPDSHRERFLKLFEALQEEGMGEHRGDCFIPSTQGMLLADGLALRFF